MKLLAINQYYPPDIASTGLYMAEICANLAQRGFCVHVVTGQPSYTSSSPKALPFEVLNGVHVHRVSLGNACGRERMRVRVEGYLRFLVGAWLKAKYLAKKRHFDAVITFHNPPFIGLIGAYLASRFGMRFVFVWYDIYPDALIVAGWRLPQVIVKVWELLNQWILSKADRVIVLGDRVKLNLVERKKVPSKKIRVIPIWAYPELAPQPKDYHIRKELGINNNDLMLLYSGNMGIMHPLDPILDAAVSLRNLPIRFVFVGDGIQRKHLISRVESENLKNVLFLPFQPQQRFVQLVASSDACFVSFKPGMENVTVPSRAFTFISAGRPLITIMSHEADVARLIIEKGCGWNVTTGHELRELIISFLSNPVELQRRGQIAREVYDKYFNREVIIEKYARVIVGDE